MRSLVVTQTHTAGLQPGVLESVRAASIHARAREHTRIDTQAGMPACACATHTHTHTHTHICHRVNVPHTDTHMHARQRALW